MEYTTFLERFFCKRKERNCRRAKLKGKKWVKKVVYFLQGEKKKCFYGTGKERREREERIACDFLVYKARTSTVVSGGVGLCREPRRAGRVCAPSIDK